MLCSIATMHRKPGPVWGNRNNAIHNDEGCPPAQVWAIAKQSQIDFTTSCSHDHPSHPTVRTHWSLPPPGFHKINVDGATTNDGGHSSIIVIIKDHTGATIGATTNDGGHSSIIVIIKDHTGATIGAFNKLLPSALPTTVTEAGVLFATKMGMSKAIFESDALVLIQTLKLKGEWGRAWPHPPRY